MSEEKPKVKYKIRYITDISEGGMPKLDNALNQYVIEAETSDDIKAAMQKEHDLGWSYVCRVQVGDWGYELFLVETKRLHKLKHID